MKKYFNVFLSFLKHHLQRLLSWFEYSGNDLLDSGFASLAEKDHSVQAAFAPESSLLNHRFTGFNLTGKGLTPHLSQTNVLVTGNTGSGKTSICLLKSVLSVDGSQIIADPSFEVFGKTSGALVQKGNRIIQINPNDPYHSHCYNLMHRARTVGQMNLLATQLISASLEKGNKDFWSSSAAPVLVCLMQVLRSVPEKYQNLYNVAHLLNSWQSEDGRKQLDMLFASMGAAHAEAFETYLSINGNSPNTLSGILATASVALQGFALDKDIAMLTSRDTIGDFRDIRKKKTAIFLHSSITKAQYMDTINSMLLSQFFEAFFEKLPAPDELDCYFHLEELPVLSINNLDLIISNIRKYRGAILGVVQDADNQLVTKYGKEKAQAILNNMKVKMYLSASLETATKLSKELGSYEYEDKKTGHTKRRELMTPDEIMSLPKDRALITVINERPILAKTRPYFKDPEIKRLTENPAAKLDYGHSWDEDEILPLLNIQEYLETRQSEPLNATTYEKK